MIARLSLLAATSLLVAALPKEEPPSMQTEVQSLHGDWQVVSIRHLNQFLPDEDSRRFTCRFSANTIVTLRDGHINCTETYRLLPGGKPGRIEMVTNGVVYQGIYDVTGDRLRLFYGHAGNAPTDFNGRGSLWVLKRKRL